MARRVLRILGLTLLGLGLAVASFVYVRYLRPSGDVAQFRAYYVSQSDALPRNGAVKVTFLGTSTLLIDDGETQLMTDGFLSRPSLWTVATSKIATDPAVVDGVLARVRADRLRAIFVAHSHYDHAMDAPYVARKTGATLHGSASTLNVGRGGGLPESQLALYAPGKPLTIGRFVVTVLTSKHTPAVKGVNDDLGQTIDAPLQPPARAGAYKEGGRSKPRPVWLEPIPTDLDPARRKPFVERIDGFDAGGPRGGPDHGVGKRDAVRRPTQEQPLYDRSLVEAKRGEIAPLQKLDQSVDDRAPGDAVDRVQHERRFGHDHVRDHQGRLAVDDPRRPRRQVLRVSGQVTDDHAGVEERGGQGRLRRAFSRAARNHAASLAFAKRPRGRFRSSLARLPLSERSWGGGMKRIST